MKQEDHNKIIGVVILVLVLVATWIKHKYQLPHNYFLFGVLAAGAILYSSDTLGKLFAKYWMAFGKLIGDFNAKILLSVLFLFLLTPLAWLKKLTAKKKVTKKSNWEDVSASQMDFTKPW